jgi:hypothetical protein
MEPTVSNGVYFTEEELSKLTVDNLLNVLDYLGVEVGKSTSKAKLILLVLEHQKKVQPYLSGDLAPENPKYSVRVQRIMDAKARGEFK